jgi:hypothetical protein
MKPYLTEETHQRVLKETEAEFKALAFAYGDFLEKLTCYNRALAYALGLEELDEQRQRWISSAIFDVCAGYGVEHNLDFDDMRRDLAKYMVLKNQPDKLPSERTRSNRYPPFPQ